MKYQKVHWKIGNVMLCNYERNVRFSIKVNNAKITYNVPVRESNKNGHRLDIYYEVPKNSLENRQYEVLQQ